MHTRMRCDGMRCDAQLLTRIFSCLCLCHAQICGREHVLADEDVVQIVKKIG
jgi:hypothetical protein